MKKLLIVTAVILCVSVAGGGLYILQKRQQAKIITPEAAGGTTTTPAPQELSVWKDPAGFTFQYPKGAEVNKHDEDQTNYAHIELTQKDHPGTIIVWAKDTSAADAAGWVKSEKGFSGGTVFDTSLGEMSGKKVILTTPKKTIVSGIVDEGVVFYVEGIFEDSEYWSKAYDAITSSFAFIQEKQPASTGNSAASEESVDEEEVVE